MEAQVCRPSPSHDTMSLPSTAPMSCHRVCTAVDSSEGAEDVHIRSLGTFRERGKENPRSEKKSKFHSEGKRCGKILKKKESKNNVQDKNALPPKEQSPKKQPLEPTRLLLLPRGSSFLHSFMFLFFILVFILVVATFLDGCNGLESETEITVLLAEKAIWGVCVVVRYLMGELARVRSKVLPSLR